MNQMMLQVAGAEGGGLMQTIGGFAPLLILVVVMYLFMIRPQKKKEKQVQEMRSKLDVGDEIVTIGGIIGTVVNLRDDYIVIETGSDRSKVRIERWAVQTNKTAKDAVAESK